MLALSILAALLAHGALLAVAPTLEVSAMRPMIHQSPRLFRVKIRKDPPPPPDPQLDHSDNGLATTPGTLEDLLKNEDNDLDLLESLLAETLDVPQLSDRVASDTVERDHYLEQSPDSLRAVDTKIIEIAQDTARQDIQIARRLVRPSPNRILPAGALPVLRGESDLGGGPIAPAALPATSLLDRPPAPRDVDSQGAGVPPPYEENVVAPKLPDLAPPTPLVDDRVAPVIEAILDANEYEFLDDLVDIKLDTFMPTGDEKGFFRLQITPKTANNIESLPKDVTFVIDASSSIVQRKLDETARGLARMVDALGPEDRFNIVVFRDSAAAFRETRVAATAENRAAARRFLEGQESRGETDVYNAIQPVLQEPPRDGVPGIVLMMTDGRPTKGVRDARTIINNLSAENVQGNTIFAYGGGNTVDRYLLDLLAYRNKGDSHVTDSIGAIDGDLPAFFTQLRAPLLVGLNADYGSIDEAEVYPKNVPDFYEQRPITVYGRFAPEHDTDFAMRLTGDAQATRKEIVFRADLGEAQRGDEDIARHWARAKIYNLIGEMCRVGEKPELLAEVRELGRKYGVKTSYDE